MGSLSDMQAYGDAGAPRYLDLLIVGAGFAGMYMLVRARTGVHRMRDRGGP